MIQTVVTARRLCHELFLFLSHGSFTVFSGLRVYALSSHNIWLFLIVFLFGCLMINGSQFVILLPLKLLPFRRARKLYYEGVRYTKGAFGALLGESLSCSKVTGGWRVEGSTSERSFGESMVRSHQLGALVRNGGARQVHP